MTAKLLWRCRMVASSGAFRACLFGGLALLMTWPLLREATMVNVFRDAQVLFAYQRNAVWAVQRYWQLPQWDPFSCGGLFALGTPQSRFAAPTLLLDLLFGADRGEALTIFALIALGLEGTFRWARALGGGALGALLAAPTFAASGVFIASPYLGWTNFFGFQLLPWVALGIHRAVRGDPVAAVGAGWFLAWMIGFGGTYAAPMTGLLALFLLGIRLGQWRPGERFRWRAIGLFAVALLGAVGAAAVRLAPLLETLYVAPRILGGRPGMTSTAAVHALIDAVAIRNGNLVSTQQMFVVGGGALVVALGAAGRRRSGTQLLLAGLAFVTALGFAAPGGGTFALLKRLPLYTSLRYPERYLILVALAVSALAAMTVQRLQLAGRRGPCRRWASVGLLLSAGLLIGNGAFLIANFRQVAGQRWMAPAPPALDRPFQQARGNRWRSAYYAPMSRGSLSCWDAYPVPMSPLLRGDLPQDEYLRHPEAGQVVRRRWSPNALDVDVTLTAPTDLLVNQNHHPGWRSDVGQVHDHQGLLAVSLPPGQHQVHLRFRPRAALAGATASLTAGLTSLWLLGRRRRRGRAGLTAPVLALAVAAPLLVFAGSIALIREPLPSPAPLRAPTGDLVMMEGAPRPEADHLVPAIGFGDFVLLEAVHLPPSETVVVQQPLTLALYLRVTSKPARDTEIRVALRIADTTVVRADHQLISAAIGLADAPRDTLLRDVLTVVLPATTPVGEVEVWVGVADASTGKRWPPRAAPGMPVNTEDAVLVGRLARAP